MSSDGAIHYFIAGGRGGQGGGMGEGGSAATASATWVESTFKAATVGDVTLYDPSIGQRSV